MGVEEEMKQPEGISAVVVGGEAPPAPYTYGYNAAPGPPGQVSVRIIPGLSLL